MWPNPGKKKVSDKGHELNQTETLQNNDHHPRQEYWSGLPFPSPRDLPDPEIEPASPILAGRFFTTEPPRIPNCWASRAQRTLNSLKRSHVKIKDMIVRIRDLRW